MKSNLYSIFVFILCLTATYFISNNIRVKEAKKDITEMSIQSQAIAHSVQQQVLHHGQLLSTTAQRWHSIEEINKNWEYDVQALQELLPHYSNIKVYLLQSQPSLTIDKKHQARYTDNLELRQQGKHLISLDKNIGYSKKDLVIQSEHHLLINEHVVVYQLAPLFNKGELFGYLEATLDITDLLDYQVATFQIIYPFSISEAGRTIYSMLPEIAVITDVKQQVNIPLWEHNWKLMIWPLHQFNTYKCVAIIGFIVSVMLSLLLYLSLTKRSLKQKVISQASHIIAINKDFNASKSKLVQSNKLSSLGEIATGIAHEINQPLQVINIHADMCQESLQKQEYRLVDKSFRTILAQVERIEKIVKQVGSFGRDSELDNYNQELPSTIFDNVIDIVINQYNQENVELRQVLPASLPTIFCNKTQIEQVLVNLLINAKDAVEECEEKVVFIKAHDKKGKLYIEVSDSGTGIEESKLDEIFTPFYTTKALGRGTGLGLSISYSIILQHKGEFQVSSEVNKGSTFTVILPLHS